MYKRCVFLQMGFVHRGTSVFFRVLGAIEVVEDGSSFPLGGPRQRSVLADLVMHAGQTVRTVQLIDDVWGADPPASAVHTVETYVSRLRQVLGASRSAVPLLTKPTGYMVDVPLDHVDVWQFRDLAARGGAAAERGDSASAVSLLTSALTLWRGAALADVREAAFAAVAAERLDGERLTALEELMEARLRLGHHRELVPELEALVADSPYREGFHVQLMMALYRSGRQADALEAFRRAREHLVGELGIEPGPDLRTLQGAILRQAPELELDGEGTGQQALTATPAHSQQTRPVDQANVTASLAAGGRARARRGRARRLALLAAILLGAAVALPTVLAAGPAVQGTVLADSVGELTAAGTGVTRSVALPGPPDAAVSADGSVWVASSEENAVYRINPVTAAVVQAIPVGSGPSAMVANGQDIWVANTLNGTVSRINAAVDRVVQTVPVGTEPVGIAAGGGSLWVTDAAGSTLWVLDPVSGQPTGTIPLASAPSGVAFGDGAVWVTSPDDDSVIRVDPRSGQPGRPIRVGAGPTAIAFGLGSVWVANGLDSTVSRIDPSTGTVTVTIPAEDGVNALAIAGHSVWAAARLASALTRINAGTDSPGLAVPVGGSPVALTASGGNVWVAADAAVSVRPSYGTLRVVSTVRPTSIDPALQYPSMGPVFGQSTYDTLVTFQETGGSAGLQLVPDLALAMPTVSAGGMVYTFTLRPGLRYSTGRPVLAQDFRYAIERVMDLNAQAASFLDGIVGAAACTPGERCDLSRGIITDNAAKTVTFRLTAPDADFLYKLAFRFTAPVPQDVPMRDSGTNPVPGTGPYMITRYLPGQQVIFARNPYFREWSAAAQPQGFPAGMVWTFGGSVTRETAEIEDGQADWTDDPLPDVAGLIARFPAQVHVNPLPAIVYTAFNTRVAPFNDPRVRRAFSLAADRSNFVAMIGGPDLAAPTCQILPPGIPGYEPYCPFTTDPGASGAWVGPDLAAARQLVAESGTSGMHVTVWSDDFAPDPTTGAFTVSVLRELGYRASLHIATPQALQAVNDSRRRIQATDGNWFADYPSASDFFDLFFRCSAFRLADPADTRNGSFFCDPAIDRLMNVADAQQATGQAQAAATWAAVDRAVTFAAPWVPLAILNNVDFVSARVTNYQYNLFFGILLDQLQIRGSL
jgi:YVTN family beta-propeller protein